MKTIITAAALILAAGCQDEKPATPAGASTQSAPAAAQADGVQTLNMNISGGEYQPASMTVRAGVPVRLNVTRDGKPTCGDVLTIPSQNISKPIPVNEVTTIEFTPRTAGDLEFTCGMNMMRGKIVVQ